MTPPRSDASKESWRARLSAARRARPERERLAARRAISGYLLATVRDLALARADQMTVCAYLPLASEPLAPELPALLVAAGHRVLVPVAARGQPLDWAELPADSTGLVAGSFGIAEPSGPRQGAAAVAAADLVLVPALAVDRRGARLGRGGGFYDRSLQLLPESWPGRTVAVVFDDEYIDHLPADSHDVPVRAVVTPSLGIVAVGRG